MADAQRRFSRSAVLVDEIPEQTEPSPTPEERVIAAVDAARRDQLLDRLPLGCARCWCCGPAGMSADVIGQQLG